MKIQEKYMNERQEFSKPSQLVDHGSKRWIIFWSRDLWSKNEYFLILDQKWKIHFLIQIKNEMAFFWSRSKKLLHSFGPNQKWRTYFLIQIMLISWSGSWNNYETDHILIHDHGLFNDTYQKIKLIWSKFGCILA